MKDAKIAYETMSWNDAQNPQMPDDMSRFTTKKAAMSHAQKLAKQYALVEVNRLEINPEDEMDLWGGYLEAQWTNGRRTVK